MESALESIVLLKNTNRSLPLNVDQLINKKIALIGPTANATELMQGSYFGKAPFLIDPVTAIKLMTAGIFLKEKTRFIVHFFKINRLMLNSHTVAKLRILMRVDFQQLSK